MSPDMPISIPPLSLYTAVNNVFNFVWLLLLTRILLSWFPNIEWWKQPFKLLLDVTEPILAPFRALIPPIGGLDLSPIVAFLAIQVLQSLVLSFIH